MKDSGFFSLRKRILKSLRIEDVASRLMGEPVTSNTSSKWNILYSSFYTNDTDPSFKISTKLQRFCCFATHHTGDAIYLYQEFYRVKKNILLTGNDLYQFIIKEFNLNIGIDNSNQEFEKKYSVDEQLIISFFEELMKVASYNLTIADDSSFDDAKKYLTQERKLTVDTIIQFELGYIKGQNQVDNIIRKTKIDKDYLIANKILKDDGLFSLLNRILIPIKDRDGRIVSIVGRDVNELSELRYLQLNANEELSNLKSNSYLYGLDLALSYVRQFNIVYLVEGYFDVMMLHQIGVKNIVAMQTTSLTKQQKEELRKLNLGEIVLLLDADVSGQNRQEEGAKDLSLLFDEKNLMFVHRKVSVISNQDYLDSGLDPCDFFKNYSLEELVEAIADRTDFRNLKIEECYQKYITDKNYHIEDLYSDVGQYIVYYNNSYLDKIKEYLNENKQSDLQGFNRLFNTDISIQSLFLMHELGYEKFYCEKLLSDSIEFISDFSYYNECFNQIYDVVCKEGDSEKVKIYKSVNNRKIYGLKKTKFVLEYGEQYELEFTIELDYLKGDLIFFKRFPSVQKKILDNQEVREDKNFFDIEYYKKIEMTKITNSIKRYLSGEEILNGTERSDDRDTAEGRKS